MNNYPGLECPMCNKWGVIMDYNNSGECPNCETQFCEDDLCQECNTLIKGTCFYCQMD